MFILEVSGIGCGSCVSKITQAIQAVDASAQVAIDRAAGKVSVESLASPTQISTLLQALGYPNKISI
jgi:copper chaperone